MAARDLDGRSTRRYAAFKKIGALFDPVGTTFLGGDGAGNQFGTYF